MSGKYQFAVAMLMALQVGATLASPGPLNVVIEPGKIGYTPAEAAGLQFYIDGDTPSCGRSDLGLSGKMAEADSVREVATAQGWAAQPSSTYHLILASPPQAAATHPRFNVFYASEKPSAGRYRIRVQVKGCSAPTYSTVIQVGPYAGFGGNIGKTFNSHSLIHSTGLGASGQHSPGPATALPGMTATIQPTAAIPAKVRQTNGFVPQQVVATGLSVLEPDTNLFGGDYANRIMTSAQQCQQVCMGESRCKAWTWVRPGVQGPSAVCWLKQSVPVRSHNICCTSGVK
jgi:hypothetical protein